MGPRPSWDGRSQKPWPEQRAQKDWCGKQHFGKIWSKLMDLYILVECECRRESTQVWNSEEGWDQEGWKGCIGGKSLELDANLAWDLCILPNLGFGEGGNSSGHQLLLNFLTCFTLLLGMAFGNQTLTTLLWVKWKFCLAWTEQLSHRLAYAWQQVWDSGG